MVVIRSRLEMRNEEEHKMNPSIIIIPGEVLTDSHEPTYIAHLTPDPDYS